MSWDEGRGQFFSEGASNVQMLSMNAPLESCLSVFRRLQIDGQSYFSCPNGKGVMERARQVTWHGSKVSDVVDEQVKACSHGVLF